MAPMQSPHPPTRDTLELRTRVGEEVHFQMIAPPPPPPVLGSAVGSTTNLPKLLRFRGRRV